MSGFRSDQPAFSENVEKANEVLFSTTTESMWTIDLCTAHVSVAVTMATMTG